MKDASTNGSVLVWPTRLLSADDLRRHLVGQKELVLLPKTVITPLAADELRAKGIRVRWETAAGKEPTTGGWFYAQEKQDPLIVAAVQAVERESIRMTLLEGSPRTLAEVLVKNYVGGIVFCSNGAATTCIVNKIAGARAAMVWNTNQVLRAKKSVGANLYVIEVPGPTFFETRHMLKAIVTTAGTCPDDVAKTLEELDGHAHR